MSLGGYECQVRGASSGTYIAYLFSLTDTGTNYGIDSGIDSAELAPGAERSGDCHVVLLLQELEGAFMIVFDRAPMAMEWCLMLQELMMEVRGGSPEIGADGGWRKEVFAWTQMGCPHWLDPHPQVPWTHEVLALPDSGEAFDPDQGTLLWRGPRVKMGLYKGTPAKVI